MKINTLHGTNGSYVSVTDDKGIMSIRALDRAESPQKVLARYAQECADKIARLTRQMERANIARLYLGADDD